MTADLFLSIAHNDVRVVEVRVEPFSPSPRP